MAEVVGGQVPGVRPLDLPRTRSPVRLLLPETLLTDLLAGLAAAAGTADVATACLRLLAEGPGVRAAAVAQRNHRHAVILGSTGYDCLSMAAGAELPISSGLPVTEAIRTGRAVVQGSGPSWVAVPFGGGAAQPGALLLSLDGAAPEGTADLGRLHRLARALGDALNRARSVEGAQARLAAVTAALQPASAPAADVVVRCAAADGQVAGDVVVCLPDGRGGRWLVVADVVGTGLVAGLVGRSVRAAVRTASGWAEGPAALLVAVDQGIADDVPPGCFVTALAVHLDAAGTLTAASAGHPPPVVVTGRPAVVEIEPGPPLALETHGQSGYRETRTTVPPGSLLLLHTDGLVERRTSDGVRLLDVVALAQDLPHDLEAAADRLLAAADAAGSSQDDVSVLLLRTP